MGMGWGGEGGVLGMGWGSTSCSLRPTLGFILFLGILIILFPEILIIQCVIAVDHAPTIDHAPRLHSTLGNRGGGFLRVELTYVLFVILSGDEGRPACALLRPFPYFTYHVGLNVRVSRPCLLGCGMGRDGRGWDWLGTGGGMVRCGIRGHGMGVD